jgi:hypothetical protein
MTLLLAVIALLGWVCAIVFFILFILAGMSIGIISGQLSEAKQDLEIYKNTANVFGKNSQGRFRND